MVGLPRLSPFFEIWDLDLRLRVLGVKVLGLVQLGVLGVLGEGLLGLKVLESLGRSGL